MRQEIVIRERQSSTVSSSAPRASLARRAERLRGGAEGPAPPQCAAVDGAARTATVLGGHTVGLATVHAPPSTFPALDRFCTAALPGRAYQPKMAVSGANKNGTGWPKSWARFRPLIGSPNKNGGRSRAIWANPVQFVLRGAGADAGELAAARRHHQPWALKPLSRRFSTLHSRFSIPNTIY
jgi:hypothetical protein